MKKVLVFDDDLDILEVLEMALSDKGWEVIKKTSCHNLLEVLDEHQPDVVLMDNWIPDTGGVIATRAIKADPRFANIKVIYFSANNDVANLAASAGADSWLAKPFDLTELDDILK